MKLVKWTPNERVDLPDQEAGMGGLALKDLLRVSRLRILPVGRNGGQAGTEARIFDGFDLYGAAGALVYLRRGSGIFPITVEGAVQLGLVMGEVGDSFKTIDCSGFSDGDHAVYVRGRFVASTRENRVLVDASGNEYVSHVDTRSELTWEYVAQEWAAASPGAEYVKVGKITTTSGAVTATEDYRHFFFEGDGAAGAGQWAAEWGGGANDRNADRAAYGIKDLHKFVQFTRTQFQSILGSGKKYWEIPDPDLTDLAAEHNTNGTHGNVNADQVDIGTPGTHEYRIMAGSDGSERWTFFRCLDAANQGDMVLTHDKSEVYARVSIHPKGNGSSLSNGDNGEFYVGEDGVGGPRYGFRATKVGATQTAYALGNLAGSPAVLINEGTGYGASARGMVLQEGSYHLPAKTKMISSPTIDYLPSTTNWTKGLRTPGVPSIYMGSHGNGTEVAYLQSKEFPSDCTLNYVLVNLAISGATPTTPLTVAVYRCRKGAGATISRTLLQSATYALSTTAGDTLMILTTGSSMLAETDWIVLEITPADAASSVTTHVDTVIDLNCTFNEASKYA